MRSLKEKLLKILSERIQHRFRRKLARSYPILATYSFDYASVVINTWGRMEDKELHALADYIFPLISDRAHCLDIGANIGNHALFFKDHFASVQCFEPVPRTFRLLEINAELSDKLHCHMIAASDRSGRAEIIEDPVDSIEASLTAAKPGRDAVTRQPVDVRPLDAFLPDEIASNVGFMKVDVEGHELAALRGCRQIIEASRPVIAFEQFGAGYSDGTFPVVEFLRGLGYEAFYELRDGTPGWLPARLAVAWKIARLLGTGRDSKLAPALITRFEPRHYTLIVATGTPLPPG